MIAPYRNVKITFEPVGSRDSALFLQFSPPEWVGLSNPPPPGWSNGNRYGLVRPGDYVYIDAAARQVFVNGEPRTAR